MDEAYNEYVANYKKEQETEFYKEHKSDYWFIERYHPVENYKIKQD